MSAYLPSSILYVLTSGMASPPPNQPRLLPSSPPYLPLLPEEVSALTCGGAGQRSCNSAGSSSTSVYIVAAICGAAVMIVLGVVMWRRARLSQLASLSAGGKEAGGGSSKRSGLASSRKESTQPCKEDRLAAFLVHRAKTVACMSTKPVSQVREDGDVIEGRQKDEGACAIPYDSKDDALVLWTDPILSRKGVDDRTGCISRRWSVRAGGSRQPSAPWLNVHPVCSSSAEQQAGADIVGHATGGIGPNRSGTGARLHTCGREKRSVLAKLRDALTRTSRCPQPTTHGVRTSLLTGPASRGRTQKGEVCFQHLDLFDPALGAHESCQRPIMPPSSNRAHQVAQSSSCEQPASQGYLDSTKPDFLLSSQI